MLDPACGSGNFLYVTLEHLKRLEGEVLNQLHDLGESQDSLDLEGTTVTLQQLRGIELNERAAALAELVLWIGYLQWQIRTRGNQGVAEPVVHDYGNIECRDAVLAWDDVAPAHDADGNLLQRWDGRTFKRHPVTDALVPDEAAQVPQWKYIGARKAEWPEADFIVGNPPVIGNKRMREALGDGYVVALRGAWPEMPESADFVMYWWHHAAQAVSSGAILRSGLITTNSLTMIFNRRVVQGALDKGAVLAYAIPDHPWVDSANGAAVRIAMTVLTSKPQTGLLFEVQEEREGEFGEIDVLLIEHRGALHADLTVGAAVTTAVALRANESLSNRGVIPHGSGFVVTPEQAEALGRGKIPDLERHIRAYRNGKDLTDRPRGVMVIDLFGLTSEQVRSQFPAVYQWLLERVKPERDLNPRKRVQELWWLFAETRTVMRRTLAGLDRYIATGQVAKHRIFQFLDGSILPDDKLIAIGCNDTTWLGVLSSKVHAAWALATGGRLGVGNDSVYSKTTCFERFPFPDTGLTPALRERIATLAEQLDAHRKRQQAAHAGLTLTGTYNVLEALRAGRALTAKEKLIHEQGLVGVLRELHDELDAAVLEAYGWQDLIVAPDNALLLERLVALNAGRAAEEKAGVVRWLRPDFQNPKPLSNQELPAQARRALEPENAQENMAMDEPAATAPVASPATPAGQQPWPSTLPEQVRAVAQLLVADGASIALPLATIEAGFKGRGPWKRGLPRILDTLEALGRARQTPEGAWQGM